MARKPELAVARAVAAGTLAALCLEAVAGGLAPVLGLPRLDYVQLIGTLAAAGFSMPASRPWLIPGLGFFIAGGIGWALTYAAHLHDRLLGPGWLQGLAFGGFGVFLMTSLVFFPALGVVHPEVRANHMPAPGLFGIGLSGSRVVLVNFVGHCVFGLIVGVLYRRRFVF